MRFEKDYKGMLVKVWVVADPCRRRQVVNHSSSSRGRGGSTIRSVQDRTNAKIAVGKGGGDVQVRADDRRSVDQAVRMIHDIAVNGTRRFSDN